MRYLGPQDDDTIDAAFLEKTQPRPVAGPTPAPVGVPDPVFRESTPAPGLERISKPGTVRRAPAGQDADIDQALRNLRVLGPVDPDTWAKVQRAARVKGISPKVAEAIYRSGTEEQQAALEKPDAVRLLEGLESTSRWLADPDNAAIARDDIEGVSRMERLLLGRRRERGFFTELADSTMRGSIQLGVAFGNVNAVLNGDRGPMSLRQSAELVAMANREVAESIARSDPDITAYRERIDRAQGWAKAGAILSDIEGFASFSLEQLANSVPALAGGFAGGAVGSAAGAATGGAIGAVGGTVAGGPVGAAAGAATGVAVGRVVGGVAGAAGGAFAGGAGVEIGMWVNQMLTERGYNVQDADSLMEAYTDADLMDEIRAESVTKGLTVASVDALSMAVGGRLLSRASRAGVPTRRIVGAAVAEGGIQMGLEGVGEVASQVAIGRTDDLLGEGLTEALAAGPTSAVEVMTGARRARIDSRDATIRTAVEVLRDVKVLQKLGRLYKDSVAARRAPEQVGKLVDEMAGPRYIDTEVWTRMWAEKGVNPAEELMRLLPDAGPRIWMESLEVGHIEVPTSVILEAYAGDARLDEVIAVSRSSPSEMTQQEAVTALEGAFGGTVEEDAAGAVTLDQSSVEDLSTQASELDDQIAAEGDVEAEDALPADVVEMDPERLEAMAAAVAAGEAVENPDVQARADVSPETTAHALRVAALTQRRQAVQEQIDEHAVATQDREGALERITARAEAQLLSAGRGRLESRTFAPIVSRFFDVLDERSEGATSLEELEGSVEMRRGKASREGAATMDQPLPATIEIDGVQRPTTDSTGQQIHPTEQGVRNFWKSYEGPVDDSGRPLLVPRTNAVSAALLDESPVPESGPDGLSRNAELFADLIVTPAFRLHGLGGLDVPTQRVVLAVVGSFGHDQQVLDSVVGLLPVDVVDHLSRSEVSPESLFRDPAVLRDLLSGDNASEVATAVDVADALVVAVAGVSTESLDGSVEVLGGAEEGGPAAITDYGYFSVSVHDPNIADFKAIGNRGTFDPSDPVILHQSPPLDVPLVEVDQPTRGGASFVPGDEQGTQRSFLLQFLKDADPSTFIHEFVGHIAFEMLGDVASRENAPQALKDDYQAFLDFAGLENRADHVARQAEIAALIANARAEGRKLTTEENARRVELAEPMERVARAAEAYFLRGEAPAPGLRRAFAMIGRWLLKVYKSLRALNVELTPEVIGLFDRLLATDAEIAATEARRGGAGLGLNPDLEAAANATATAQMNRAVLRSQAASMKAERKEAIDAAKPAIRAEMEKDPRFVAYSLLVDGTLPGGEALPDGAQAPKVDRADLEAAYGADSRKARTLRELGATVGPEQGGLTIDTLAEELGLPDGDALVDAVIWGSRLDRWVEAEARRVAREENRELFDTPAAMQSLAERSVENEDMGRLLEADFRALLKLAEKQADDLQKEVTKQRTRAEKAETADKAGDAARKMEEGLRRRALAALSTRDDAEARKAEALRSLQSLPIRDIKPHVYLAAMRRENTSARKFYAQGKHSDAALAQRRALVAHERYRIANKLLDTARKDVRQIRKMDSDARQDAMRKAGGGHLEAANGILERFQFRDISGKESKKRATLAAYLDERELEGRPLAVPDYVLDEAFRRDYQSLTPQQLHDLRETLDGIWHLASVKGKLTAAKRKREIREIANEIKAAAEATGAFKELTPNAATGTEQALDFAAAYLAMGDKASYTARIIDGGRDGGPAVTHIIRPINEATDATAILQREHMTRYAESYGKHFNADEMAEMHRRKQVAGASVSHADRLAIGLHWGHEEGRQRLGLVYTPDQIRAILNSLSDADLDWIEGMWSHFDELFQQNLEVERRVTGQKPVAVKHLDYSVRGRTLAGGYGPLAYKDQRLWSGEGALDAVKALASGRAPSSMMRLGFNKKRVAKLKGVLDLDHRGFGRHIKDITQAIGMREAVIDVQAILKHPVVRDAISAYHGKAKYQQLGKWIENVASSTSGPRTPLERAVGYLRQGSVLAQLAFSIKSPLMQVFGIKYAALRVGYGWTWRATRELFGSAKSLSEIPQLVESKSRFMAERVKGSLQRELNEFRLGGPAVGPLRKGQQAADAAREHGFWLFKKMQRVADVITWTAQYNKTMSERPADVELETWDREAVARADQAVKDAQSGGQDVDLSNFEAGGPLSRLFSTYFTEASLKFNQTRLSASQTKWKDPGSFGRFLADMVVIYFTEIAVLSAMAILSGQSDADDELDDLPGEFAASVVDQLPLLRELSGTFRGFDYRGPAGLGLFQQTSRTAQNASWKSVNMLAGNLLHYPAKSVENVAVSIGQVFDGEIPTGLIGLRERR